jgi:ADP-heptose:LPS heptosyltransferase
MIRAGISRSAAGKRAESNEGRLSAVYYRLRRRSSTPLVSPNIPPAASRILVVRAGALGDTLMATPVVAALRRRHPGASIDFLCSADAAPLLELNPNIRRVWPLRNRNLPHAVSVEKRRLARELANEAYELAVVLEHADRYFDLVRRSGVRDVRGFDTVRFDPALHAIANNLRAAGFERWDDERLQMDLSISDADRLAADDLLRGFGGPVVGVHAGYGPPRRKQIQEHRLRGWSAEHFSALGRTLVERGLGIVLTGSAGDRELADRIARTLPVGSCLQLAGRTSLRQLAAVIERTMVFVSVDSEPAHVAAAVGTPLVVLWGPGILEQTRPMPGRSPVRVVRHPVPCAPCYGTPLMKTCRQNICMESIAPADALAAIDEIASVTPRPAG